MSDSWIYFIRSEGGPVKVGHSINPAGRLESLQSGHFQTLTLIGLTPGTRFDEEKLHGRLAEHALGREWYAPHADVFAEIVEPVESSVDTLNAAVAVREHVALAIRALRAPDYRTIRGGGRPDLNRARRELIAARDLLVGLGLDASAKPGRLEVVG